MSEYPNFANPIGNRLKAEMKKRGMTSTELARNANVLTSFIYDIISGKSSNPSTVKLARVAEALGISLTYLVCGSEEMNISSETLSLSKKISPILTIIGEDLSGSGNIIACAEKENSDHFFNNEWIRSHLNSAPDNLRLFYINGDGMEPTLLHGDSVLVDISRKTPSPPSLFLIFDGLGLTVKRLEYFLEGSTSQVRVISDNPHYSTYECSISELTIIGRVVWFSRII